MSTRLPAWLRSATTYDRIERTIAASHEEHPERHTRRYRLRMAAGTTALIAGFVTLWSFFEVTDSWSAIDSHPLLAAAYVALWANFVGFFIAMRRLTLALDGVTRLPVERLDELQRDVRQRSSEHVLGILIWGIVAIFLGAGALRIVDVPDRLLVSILMAGVYALTGVAVAGSSILAALWLPDGAADDADETAQNAAPTAVDPADAALSNVVHLRQATTESKPHTHDERTA